MTTPYRAATRLPSLTPLTIGADKFGRDTQKGSTEEADAVELAQLALASGFGYVDTSNNYAGGQSEAVMGIAAAQLGPQRSTGVITMVDVDPETGRFDRDRVLRSFEESRDRLGLDYFPLMHLHDPDMLTMAEALGPGGAVEGLIELRESGLVGAIGVAGGSIPMMSAYLATEIFDAVLCHNRFTLVDRSAKPLFEEARRQGMTIFNAAPFGAGLLSTGARPGAHYAYLPATPELQSWVRSVEDSCARHGVPLPALALAFSLQSPLVDSTIVGVSSKPRLPQLVDLSRQTIPDELWHDVAALGAAPSAIVDPPVK
jgi:D-threo-aldose 1-dehydrogenase